MKTWRMLLSKKIGERSILQFARLPPPPDNESSETVTLATSFPGSSLYFEKVERGLWERGCDIRTFRSDYDFPTTASTSTTFERESPGSLLS